MEDNVLENESAAAEVPENKFACLGIAECQQVLERLKGGFVVDVLSPAAKALLDEYKYDEDSLKREVGDRLAGLEALRKKAVDAHIAKKYAQALEAYDEYFAVLGSRLTDYEAEQLRKECLQYVAVAKKKKWQMIAAVVLAVVLCGVIVDQVFFRQSVKAFHAALLGRDYEQSTKIAIKISWRYDTEGGISNLVCFLDQKNEFNRLCGQELIRSSLDNYGGIKWQEVQELVGQAAANEDLAQGVRQLTLAVEMTTQLVDECGDLGLMEKGFTAIYEACNQKDADHYAQEKWEQLQLLRDTEIMQTNLNVIVQRYELLMDITNQVARLMDAQKDMQPVKDDFEKRLKEEQIQVQGMLNYSSSQLGEAQKRAETALKKEEQFEFADARLIYTRAIEHIKASEKQRKEDADKLAKMDQARREFNLLYGELDTGVAQEQYPDDWKALAVQKAKAESEYDRTDRWNGDAFVCYEAALVQMRKLKVMMDNGDVMTRFREEFDKLYAALDSSVSEKWFPGQWTALVDKKKAAEAAYEGGGHWEQVNSCYKEAMASLKGLEELMEEVDKLNASKAELYRLYGKLDIGLAEKWFPEDWKASFDQKKKADAAYEKGDQMEEVNVFYEVASQKVDDLLVKISAKAKQDFDEVNDKIEEPIKDALKKNYLSAWNDLQSQVETAKAEYMKPRHWESDAYDHYISAKIKLLDLYKKGHEENRYIDFNFNVIIELDEELAELHEKMDHSRSSSTNAIPSL
jgi:hypothetical protein